MFAAYLLAKFRKHLILEGNQSSAKHVAQLSDCVFVWSEDASFVLEFSRSLMWRLALDGVLCRGGLSFGQIVEPDKTKSSVGDYICGSAVTRSVNNESIGKGARVFVDAGFPEKCPPLAQSAFTSRTSKIDYRTINEFCWYLHPENLSGHSEGANNVSVLSKRDSIIRLLGTYLYSPMYGWNSKTHQGQVQIASTIDIIASSVNELALGFDIPETYENVMARRNVRGRGNMNSYFNAMNTLI